MLRQQRRLERVNAQDMVHTVADFLNPLRPPGPNGGTHQLDRGHPLLTQQSLHRQVEVRSIHTHIQIGGRGHQILNQGLPDAMNMAVTPKRLHQTAHRQLVTGPARHKTGRIHLRPANARSLQARPGFLHALQQQGRKHVPRTLGRDHAHTQIWRGRGRCGPCVRHHAFKACRMTPHTSSMASLLISG